MSSTTRVGTVIEEKFRLDEKIGEGSMGAVYRGTQLMVDRTVAVKLLHPGFAGHDKIQARFEVEARAIARLNHPNCITLYDFGYSEEMEAFYTVVEYIDGIPLEQLTASRPPVSRVVELIKQTASALGHAHHHGILHRDLKPENIMIAEMTDGSEMVKVLDFGIAQIMQGTAEEDDDFETDRLTSVGEVFGTPPYMSPEQSKSTHDLTTATDIYSLGIIFYELLEGRLPFMADTPVEIMAMHRSEPPPPMNRPGIPEPVESLVFQMLAKDPEQRPDGGEAIAEALDQIPDDQLDEPAPGGDYEVEPTFVTPPDESGSVETEQTLLSTPPDPDASTELAAERSAPGDESEVYNLSDLVEEPDDSSTDSGAQVARSSDDTTSTLDRPSFERDAAKSTHHLTDDDAEVDSLIARLARLQTKMIAGIVITVFVILAAATWVVIEFEPFVFADDKDMQEVAQFAARGADGDQSDSASDSDDAVEQPNDDPLDPTAADPQQDAPREVTVSDEQDDDQPDDDSEEDEPSEQQQDEEDEQPEQQQHEPAAEPQPRPEPPPAQSEPEQPPPAQQQPPRLDGPGETGDDDDDEQEDGPPRLDL